MTLNNKSEDQEIKDLIPWIAESIDALNKTLNLEIEIEGREQYEQDIRLDLIGTERFSQMFTIIEVQTSDADHWHLGKLLTFTATRESGIIIWIARKFDKIHKNVLEWLNKIGPAEMTFYGIELEISKEEEISLAPHFKIAVEPPASKRKAPVADTITDEDKKYLEFYEKVRERILSTYPDFPKAKVWPQSWWSVGAGRSGFSIGGCFTIDEKFRVELYCDMGRSDYNKRTFEQLKQGRYKIEQQIGKELTWDSLPDSQAFRIYIAQEAIIYDDEEKLNKLNEWAAATIIKFREVFSSLIKDIKVDL